MKKIFFLVLIPLFVGACSLSTADEKEPPVNGVEKPPVDEMSIENKVDEDIPDTTMEAPLNVEAEIVGACPVPIADEKDPQVNGVEESSVDEDMEDDCY